MKMNSKLEHTLRWPVRNDGFTLVEILIAMTVFSIGILGLMALQVTSIRRTTLSNSATVAGTIAQRHMENIIKADFRISGLVDVNVENNKDLSSINNTDYRNVDVGGRPVALGKYNLLWKKSFCDL
jgi:type IV pilus modification protein PilV